METIIPMPLIETCRRHAQLAIIEYQEANWTVRIIGPGRNTLPTQERAILQFVCGDGRYAEFFKQHPEIDPTRTVALFGSGYGIEALTGKSLREARAFIRPKGFDIRLHGDKHGPNHADAPLNCGLLGKWAKGEIPEVFRPKYTPLQMLEIARGMGIPIDILPGEHEEQALYLNYVPNRIVTPHTDRFRADAWALLQLGFPDEAHLSRLTVEALSATVRDVTIIIP
jgi:hypothetical protein